MALAGVREAPRQEIAGCGAVAVQQALWGFELSAGGGATCAMPLSPSVPVVERPILTEAGCDMMGSPGSIGAAGHLWAAV